jgi:cyclic pyranopterin phosphate synthase
LALELKRAGLKRVTVSLDALDEEVFQRMADAPGVSAADVLSGIAAAAKVGFGPLRINCVVRRNVNDSQILPMARHFAGTGHILRFIEYMDVGTRNEWRRDDVFGQDEICELLRSAGELEPLERSQAGHVATRFAWRPHGARLSSEVGVISSVTKPFCESCCRVRLSSSGQLYTCLFAQAGFDLRALLRRGASQTELSHVIAEVWEAREDRYSELRAGANQGEESARRLPLVRAEMSYIGG